MSFLLLKHLLFPAMKIHLHIFRLQISTISLGSDHNGWKSCESGWLWDWGNERVSHGLLKQWLKHEKDNLRLKIRLHLLSCLTLKDRDSEQYTDNSFSIPPPQVVWSMRRVGRSRHKLCLVLFGLCSTVPLILNSKCRHLKLKSFIHRSDCETRRRFEVLTVTSQMPFSDYRGAKKQWLLSIW